MKREEAIKIVERNYPYGYSCSNVELINKIYDDLESKGCDTCIKKPKEGENFSDECGVCMYFYSDNWEAKDAK